MNNMHDKVDIVEIENNEIQFNGYTEKYGRAYWNIGVERKEEGVIGAIYFIPGQQPDKNDIYVYHPKGEHVEHSIELGIDLMTDGNELNRLSYSTTRYCPDHDLVEESFCMPKDGSVLKIREYSASGIEIKVVK